ncbi:hypothetical protein K402DRAFT_160100 [Aulographum hederae CBS 113979]|uniref:Transmembrane protein n=1 Tax=Aulographum hederae CBS 113979 TaxID=1176131 RepID=A0A6G1GRV0_9PEZI|nr:hypothetical protein K402DRAFT_160100 [Aulographum hederae CBS 113979]
MGVSGKRNERLGEIKAEKERRLRRMTASLSLSHYHPFLIFLYGLTAVLERSIFASRARNADQVWCIYTFFSSLLPLKKESRLLIRFCFCCNIFSFSVFSFFPSGPIEKRALGPGASNTQTSSLAFFFIQTRYFIISCCGLFLSFSNMFVVVELVRWKRR